MVFAGTQSFIALAIFVATYAALALRNVREASVPIWLILLLGAVAMVLTGSIGVPQAYSAINLQVLVFLFSMFVMVKALDISGALEGFATRLLRHARSPSQVLYLSFFGFALLSTVLMNDTIALMGTPIMISLAKRLEMSVKPLLLTLAFAVTIGSAATPMGNPQNLLIGISSGLAEPILQFGYYLLVPVLVNLAATAVILRIWFRKELRSGSEPTQAKPMVDSPVRDRGLARKATALVVLTMIALVGANVAGEFGLNTPFGISEISLFGAAILLGISGRSREILEDLDWGILVMFAALFVMMQAVSDNGIISAVAGYLPPISVSSPREASAAIITSATILSQLISNVPMVGLYLPLMKTLGFGSGTAYAWAALAGGSTLAGNLTLLGAASNLIIAEQAERDGHRLGFVEFVRVGAVVTVLNVAVLYLYLYLV